MQVLVSVTTIAEAAAVLAAGVTLLDLKYPQQGPLAALPMPMSTEIVQFLRQQSQATVTVSATVGDVYPGESTLLTIVTERLALGVDILKFPVEVWQLPVQPWMILCEDAGVRCVAVLTPQRLLSADWRQDITHCHRLGYAGVMLDTEDKQIPLLSAVNQDDLQAFVLTARETGMLVGLAGGMQLSDLSRVEPLAADFVGFRGGLCQSGLRGAVLDSARIQLLAGYLAAAWS